MSYETNLLPCCFHVRASSRTQVAPLETTHQVFIKRLSYASSSVGLGKVKKHKTLSCRTGICLSVGGTGLTHMSQRENRRGRVCSVPKLSGSSYGWDSGRESNLCALKQPRGL